MKLFGKRLFGKEEEAAEEDEGDPEPVEEAEADEKRTRKKGKGGAAANIERLAAKVEALSELRKTDTERFSRISEQIGEFRNLILEKEEDIKELGIKATKAAEMVGELQPESILSEVRKSEAKYQVLEAKIEAANALYNKVMEELKEVRKRLALFQGTEELIKLNQETTSNLANIKHIEANIEGQANKIGNIYAQFQKQSNELIKYRDAAAAFANEFKGVKNSVEELKVKAQAALVGQEDLNNLRAQLRNEFNKKLELLGKTGIVQPQRGDLTKAATPQFEKDLNELKKQLAIYAAQKKFSEQLVIDTLKEARERLEKKDYDMKALRAEISSYKEKLYETVLAAQGAGEKEKSAKKGGSAQEGDPTGIPSLEKETIADFEEKAGMLRDAVKRQNAHAAITLYNQLRESYVQAARIGLAEGRIYAMRSKLLDLHKELSALINTLRK